MTADTWILLFVAISNLATAWLTYKTRQDVQVVHMATNSMKDALVAATGKAEHAAGVEQGRAERK